MGLKLARLSGACLRRSGGRPHRSHSAGSLLTLPYRECACVPGLNAVAVNTHSRCPPPTEGDLGRAPKPSEAHSMEEAVMPALPPS